MGKHIRIDMKMNHKIQFRSATNNVNEILGPVPLLYIVTDRNAPALYPDATVSVRVYYKDS